MATQKRSSWIVQMESLLKACADQTRLRILNLLADAGEVSVGHLVTVLNTNQPKVSRHLAYLKRAGLVTDRKEGLLVFYRLTVGLPAQAARLMDCLRACYKEVPELQREIMHLQTVKGACSSPAHSAPATTAVPVETEWETRSEIQIELL